MWERKKKVVTCPLFDADSASDRSVNPPLGCRVVQPPSPKAFVAAQFCQLYTCKILWSVMNITILQVHSWQKQAAANQTDHMALNSIRAICLTRS